MTEKLTDPTITSEHGESITIPEAGSQPVEEGDLSREHNIDSALDGINADAEQVKQARALVNEAIGRGMVRIRVAGVVEDMTATTEHTLSSSELSTVETQPDKAPKLEDVEVTDDASPFGQAELHAWQIMHGSTDEAPHVIPRRHKTWEEINISKQEALRHDIKETGWQAVGWTIGTASWLGEQGIATLVAATEGPRGIAAMILTRGPFDSQARGRSLARDQYGKYWRTAIDRLSKSGGNENDQRNAVRLLAISAIGEQQLAIADGKPEIARTARRLRLVLTGFDVPKKLVAQAMSSLQFGNEEAIMSTSPHAIAQRALVDDKKIPQALSEPIYPSQTELTPQ